MVGQEAASSLEENTALSLSLFVPGQVVRSISELNTVMVKGSYGERIGGALVVQLNDDPEAGRSVAGSSTNSPSTRSATMGAAGIPHGYAGGVDRLPSITKQPDWSSSTTPSPQQSRNSAVRVGRSAFASLGSRSGQPWLDSPAAWITYYFLANLSLTLYNKLLMNKFPFPWALTGIHTLCGAIGSQVALQRGYFTQQRLSANENLILVAFSTLYTVNIAVSNLSLNLVTVPVSKGKTDSSPSVFFPV